MLRRLQHEGRLWRRRQRLELILKALLIFALPVLLLALMDVVWTLRETAASVIVALAAAAAVLYALAGWWRLRRRAPDAYAVALAVEADKPAYMDSLACAVELLTKPRERWGPLDEALVTNVSARLAGDDVHDVVRRRTMSTPRLALLLGAGAAMVAALLFLPLSTKAWHQARDWMTGVNTGLTIEPGNVEIARGDDIQLRATIARGPRQARLLMWTDQGELSYDMYPAANGHFSLDIYAVDGDFTYQVVTPTLRSRRYRVTTFRRPELESFAIHVTPPAYTGLKTDSVSQLADLSAPVGSSIRMLARINMKADLQLEPLEASPMPFKQLAGDSAELAFTLEHSLNYRLKLDDRRGHIVMVPGAYRLNAVPDGPPVVQILSPEEDAVYDTTESVPFAIDAADDYGVGAVRLHYSINGGDFTTEILYEAGDGERLNEYSVSHVLALTDKVRHGDVIYYYASALDNQEPQANEGRSDIRFIEIRPKKQELEPMEPMEGAGGGENESLSLSVSDLIMAQKDLIRQTWRHQLSESSNEQERMIQELRIAAADLLLNSRKRLEDIREKAQGMPLGKIGDLFDGAIAAMRSADTMLQSGDAASSLPFQQSALSKLIQLEIELLQNAQQMQGKGQKQQQSDRPPEEPQHSEEEKDEQRQEQVAGLKKTLDKLRDLVQRQQNLNSGLEQNSVDGKFREGTRDGAIRQQHEILTGTWDVRNDISQAREARGVIEELTKAAQQMTQSRQSVQLNSADRALKQAHLAEGFLERAEELLSELIEDMSGNELKLAERMLEQLRQRQERVRQETERTARGEEGSPGTEQLGKAQAELGKEFDEIMKRMAETASELESQNPVAAKSLSDALQQARSGNVGGKMKRAENALRYKQAERSVEYQRQVEEELAKLAENLKNASEAAGGPGKEQLTQMLEKTLEDLAEMQRLAEENADDAAKQAQIEAMKRHARELDQALRDPRMEQLAGEMQKLGASAEGTAQQVQQAMNLTMQTARLLELKLLEKELAQRVDFSRLAGRQPPEEYRKLVNEYFKKLSEEY